MMHIPGTERATWRWALLVMLWLGLAAPPAIAQASPEVTADDATVTFERWYVLMFGGDRAGYAHTQVLEQGDHLITAMTTELTVRRGPMAIRVEQQSRFTETADGEPVEAVSVMKLGAAPIKKTARFTDEGIELTTEAGGQVQRQTYPTPEEPWLPPAAASRYVEQQVDAGAKRITLRTLDPSVQPTPFEMTMTIVGEEPVEVLGKVVPAVVWDVEMSAMPGFKVREYVDEEGHSLKTTMRLGPGMDVTMLAADRELALSKVSPPEVMASLFVHPDRPIAQPRSLRSAVYEVRLREQPAGAGAGADAAQAGQATDDRPFDLPRTGYQRVVWGDDRTARVVVDLDRPVEPGDDLPTDEHLGSSTMIDPTDEKVQALLAEALGDEADALPPGEKAKRLRQFVARYVTEKDLSVGFATAAEVARTAQGDCSEHAVLLAALLRAADIPSRTATGLVYVDGFLGHEHVFGGHMWTQAWLPDDQGAGRWIDLDPTLEQPFDAAHLTLGVSAMGDDGMVNTFVALTPLLSGLEIRVIEP